MPLQNHQDEFFATNATAYLNLTENKKLISVSAKTGENIKELKKLIKEIIESQGFHKPIKNTWEGVEKTVGNWSS